GCRSGRTSSPERRTCIRWRPSCWGSARGSAACTRSGRRCRSASIGCTSGAPRRTCGTSRPLRSNPGRGPSRRSACSGTRRPCPDRCPVPGVPRRRGATPRPDGAWRARIPSPCIRGVGTCGRRSLWKIRFYICVYGGGIESRSSEGAFMNEMEITRSSAFTATAAGAAERVTAFLRKVYGWMFVGLGLTGAVAVGVASSPTLVQTIFSNRILFFGLILAELGMVFYLSARVDKLAPSTASAVFLVYSALNGATLSFIFLAYTGASIATTFFVAAGMFGALALYGTTTKRSLAGVGQFVFMGLIGVVLASVVGLFWHNAALQFAISVVGVIVFTGLTAWDAQRLKARARAVPEGRVGSYAVVGALSLYLDFINLFLFLLRFLGNRRS